MLKAPRGPQAIALSKAPIQCSSANGMGSATSVTRSSLTTHKTSLSTTSSAVLVKHSSSKGGQVRLKSTTSSQLRSIGSSRTFQQRGASYGTSSRSRTLQECGSRGQASLHTKTATSSAAHDETSVHDQGQDTTSHVDTATSLKNQFSRIIKGPDLVLPQIPILSRVLEHGDDVFLRHDGHIYTYRDLMNAAYDLSKQIKEKLPTHHSPSSTPFPPRIALLAPSSFDYMAYTLAIWLAGGVSVPLHVQHPAAEMQHYLDESQSSVLLVHPSCKAKAKELIDVCPKVKRLDPNPFPIPTHTSFSPVNKPLLDPLTNYDEFSTSQSDGDDNQPSQRAAKQAVFRDEHGVEQSIHIPHNADPAIFIFTSGTTGKPKATVLTHQNLLANITGMVQEWKWQRNDHILNLLPLHHVHGVTNIMLTATWVGARVTTRTDVFNAEAIWKDIASTLCHADPIPVTPTDVELLQQQNDLLKARERTSPYSFIPEPFTVEHSLKLQSSTPSGVIPALQHTGTNYMPSRETTTIYKTPSPYSYTLFMAVPTIYSKLLAAREDLVARNCQEDLFFPHNFKKAYVDQSIDDILRNACSQFRMMVSGSMALPQTVLNSWKNATNHVLLERYGMTEIGMALTNPYYNKRIPGAVGWPFPGVECRLDLTNNDDSNHHHPDEAAHSEPVGQLMVRGKTVFQSYFNQPEKTAESFDQEWFYTGDVARIDKDDCVWLMGRSSVDIIKSSGYKVSALDVERELLEHPAIQTCSVVGLDDETYGQTIAAVVVLKNKEGTLVIDELKSWCKGRMAGYKTPQQLFIVDAIPVNAMGKINKKSLVKSINDGNI